MEFSSTSGSDLKHGSCSQLKIDKAADWGIYESQKISLHVEK